jgi:predicted nucleotidyltransferase
MVSETDEWGSGVSIRFPLPEERLFRNRATEDILLLLLRNPHQAFTVTELRTVTGHGGDTVQIALTVLEAAELIMTRQDGRKKLISANRDRFHNPDDPILAIPREPFRTPIKAFLDRAAEEMGDRLVGVILFGSVARGEADRASDIDIQIIVEDDLTQSRRELHEIRQEIEGQTFDGERYELQILVESLKSAESYGEKLQEIFSEGIVLYATEKLDDVKEVVFRGG